MGVTNVIDCDGVDCKTQITKFADHYYTLIEHETSGKSEFGFIEKNYCSEECLLERFNAKIDVSQYLNGIKDLRVLDVKNPKKNYKLRGGIITGKELRGIKNGEK